MADIVRCFIGYDEREASAYHVCCQSILEHTKAQVSFHPVRGTQRDGSNSFTYARFLVPYWCRFQGHAIFLDGDMTVRGDIEELWRDRMAGYVGVQVVKHDYKTQHPVKYLGAKNEDYPRKNWSSVVLWNCAFAPNSALTPEFVSTQPGSFLHRFQWLRDEHIGDLPAAWNHLCMEYEPNSKAKLYHYTIGLPGFIGYSEQEGAEEWRRELAAACAPMMV